MIEKEQAWAIAKEFAHDLGERWNADIIAVLVIGSLATGAYYPGRSDIDTVVILHSDAAISIDDRIRKLHDDCQATYSVPKGFGVVIFRELELLPPYADIEMVPEILRVIEQGCVIWGNLDLASIHRPSDKAISAYVKQFTDWLRANYIDQRPADARTIDATVNTILYELRCWIWKATKTYVLDKLEVILYARRIDHSEQFSINFKQIESYIREGTGFATTEEAELLLKNVSKFVRNQADEQF